MITIIIDIKPVEWLTIELREKSIVTILITSKSKQ